jgi:MerR family transcriptional regulator/heat shock protein HspR
MGVNLAGVDLILRLLEEMEDMRREMEEEMLAYQQEVEARVQQIMERPNIPVRKDDTLLPVPNLRNRRSIDL